MIVRLKQRSSRYPDLSPRQPYVVIGIEADQFRILNDAGRPAARRDGGLPLPRPRPSHLALEPKIPLYVSGFGPRAMELAGKHGDGLVFAIPPRGGAGGR